MDKTLGLVAFVPMCVLCLAFVFVLGILAFTRRKGAAIAPRLMAFYILALAGAFLSALADCWHAFGPPRGHQILPDAAQMVSLCMYGAAFWIARKPLGQVMSRFVKANGGTAGSALASALLHPGLSLYRLGSQRPVADTEPPPA